MFAGFELAGCGRAYRHLRGQGHAPQISYWPSEDSPARYRGGFTCGECAPRRLPEQFSPVRMYLARVDHECFAQTRVSRPRGSRRRALGRWALAARRAGDAPGPRADLYSLGVLLWELLLTAQILPAYELDPGLALGATIELEEASAPSERSPETACTAGQPPAHRLDIVCGHDARGVRGSPLCSLVIVTGLKCPSPACSFAGDRGGRRRARVVASARLADEGDQLDHGVLGPQDAAQQEPTSRVARCPAAAESASAQARSPAWSCARTRSWLGSIDKQAGWRRAEPVETHDADDGAARGVRDVGEQGGVMREPG